MKLYVKIIFLLSAMCILSGFILIPIGVVNNTRECIILGVWMEVMALVVYIVADTEDHSNKHPKK